MADDSGWGDPDDDSGWVDENDTFASLLDEIREYSNQEQIIEITKIIKNKETFKDKFPLEKNIDEKITHYIQYITTIPIITYVERKIYDEYYLMIQHSIFSNLIDQLPILSYDELQKEFDEKQEKKRRTDLELQEKEKQKENKEYENLQLLVERVVGAEGGCDTPFQINKNMRDSGSFGTVYKSCCKAEDDTDYDTDPNCQFITKKIKYGKGTDTTAEMVRNEIYFQKKAARIGVAPKIVEVKIEKTVAYLTMELIPMKVLEWMNMVSGSSKTHVSQHTTLLKIRVLYEIVQLLHQLHQHDIFHGDISHLGNVMIKNNRFYLIDYGRSTTVAHRDFNVKTYSEYILQEFNKTGNRLLSWELFEPTGPDSEQYKKGMKILTILSESLDKSLSEISSLPDILSLLGKKRRSNKKKSSKRHYKNQKKSKKIRKHKKH